MDLRRLRIGEWVVLAGAVALLVATFLPWYRLELPALPGFTTVVGSTLGEQTAWDAFSAVLVLILLAAGGGLALAFLTATRREPALPVTLAVLSTVFGIVATILVAYRVANPPGPNAIIDVAYGAWIGMAGAAAIAAGSWLALGDERPTGP